MAKAFWSTWETMKAAAQTTRTVKLDVRDVDEWIAESSSPHGKDFCPRKGRIPGAVWIEWYRMMKPTPTWSDVQIQGGDPCGSATVGIMPETPVIVYRFKGARASNTFVALKKPASRMSASTSAHGTNGHAIRRCLSRKVCLLRRRGERPTECKSLGDLRFEGQPLSGATELDGRISMATREKISRRTWLKEMARAWAAGDRHSCSRHACRSQSQQMAVHYQHFPRGMRTCSRCKFYISAGGRRSGMMGCPMGGGMMGHGMMGAGACQLVEGRISPMGYCDLYAPPGAP